MLSVESFVENAILEDSKELGVACVSCEAQECTRKATGRVRNALAFAGLSGILKRVQVEEHSSVSFQLWSTLDIISKT